LTVSANRRTVPSVATLNVSLPDAMREFVDNEVARGAYPTASAYVQELIRRDLRRMQARQAVLDGFASGDGGTWADLRGQLRATIVQPR
jgi:antitoxin ParD1/3/4